MMFNGPFMPVLEINEHNKFGKGKEVEFQTH